MLRMHVCAWCTGSGIDACECVWRLGVDVGCLYPSILFFETQSLIKLAAHRCNLSELASNPL